MSDALPVAGPVAESQREHAIDTLRGFALLGILAMNIMAFAHPFEAYMNPMNRHLNVYAGAYEGWNKISYWFTHIVFDLKMMSMFSMLFGAGIVLMGDRLRARSGDPLKPARFAGLHYRRMFWLLILGGIHAYFIWWGDILVSYAMCGMIIYPLHRCRPRTLLIVGFALLILGMVVTYLMYCGMHYMQDESARLQAIIDSGQTLSEEDTARLAAYNDQLAGMSTTEEKVTRNVAAFRGHYSDVWAMLVKSSFGSESKGFLFFVLWRSCGCMLLGMALLKLGVLTGKLPIAAYAKMAVTGLLVGIPVIVIGIFKQQEHEFDMIYGFGIGGQFNYVGSLFMDMAYIGIILMLLKTGRAAWLTVRLSFVGRMAFTNYLTQSLICTSIFYGWGLGYFAKVERAPLMLVVLAIWILQILWSPIWLSYFRMGPFEWVWRSLTYWRLQPMRRAA